MILARFDWELDENIHWTTEDLVKIYQTGMDISNAVGGSENVYKIFGHVVFTMGDIGNNNGETLGNTITLSSNRTWENWAVAHELGHVWNNLNQGKNAEGLEAATGGYTDSNLKGKPSDCNTALPGCNKAEYYYGGIPATGANWRFNRSEDFSESFAAYVYPELAKDRNSDWALKSGLSGYDDYTQEDRWNYVNDLITKYTNPIP